MKLRYTKPAATELNALLDFLWQQSPSVSKRVADRLRAVTSLLLFHPQAGQPTRRPGMRRLVATPYPYLIFYQVSGDEIVIHSVRHSARKPSSRLGQR